MNEHVSKDLVLARLSETVSSARSLEELTRPLLELLELITGLESTFLTRIDFAAGIQNVLFSRNSSTLHLPETLSVPWGDTLCKRALAEQCPYADDVSTRWGDSEAARVLGIETFTSTPVYLEGGSLYGTLCAASCDRKPISSDGQHVLRLFSALIAQQIQQDQLMQELRRANAQLAAYSFTDALTGLPNRRFILDELQRMMAQAARSGQNLIVAFIDLDGFKAINDAHGHDAGDAFLIEVGRRLSLGLRAGDVLGRLGGDEFVMVGFTAPGEPGRAPADATRQRLTALIEGHYELGRWRIDYEGASIGVIEAEPGESAPEEILRRADALMYETKKARRATRRSATG
ncbi:GGDEF domain-containing protein [Azorhizobium caulinodans]|uniref:GGDEF domain-containing protein n=1 Tax=Azorhizobium caulinodans TaxID=7 RepID=UPI0002E44B99|nr:sensor domain-containing diguanylate cyclase [Azorhizobium caulinodans]